MAGSIIIPNSNSVGLGNTGADNGKYGLKSQTIFNGERYRLLDQRQAYYECTQHDMKRVDFDGRVIAGPRAGMPLLGGERMTTYVPLKERRPGATYRLAKIIVDSFTNLLFGEQRFPSIRVDGDPNTEDFAQTLVKMGKLSVKFIQARNLGGSMGSVGLSWCYITGRPRFDYHNAKNIFVHEWEDRTQLIPSHVSEVLQYTKQEFDPKGNVVPVRYWFRRDWTKDADIIYQDVLVDNQKEPQWVPDPSKTVTHNDDLCHFIWVQNFPNEDMDGIPDYEGLYESFDEVDILFSIIMRGAKANLDPTLKLKMDPDLVARGGIKKGSDNAIVTGVEGDASYMELQGTSLEVGLKILEAKRRAILETAQCIIPDPKDVAAQGISSVAIKAMFAPMTGKADVLREQYGSALERLLEGPIVIARQASKSRVIIVNDDGSESQGQPKVDLPPKIEHEPVLDENGNDTGETKINKVDRIPGEGGEISTRWPAYFLPTPTDQTATITTLNMATGGLPIMAKQTATELAAQIFGIDPSDEWKRLSTQHVMEAEQQAQGMFPPGSGGEVAQQHNLPPGATPRPKKPDDSEGASDDEKPSKDEP